MKIKPGFEMRNVCGEKVVIATGLENLDFSKMISLNETAAYLWEAAEGKDFSEAQLVEALCQEYEVSPEQAANDVAALIENWKELGLVE